MGLNPVQASKIEYLIGLRKQQYSEICVLREYAAGKFPQYLTDDQKIQIVGENSAGTPNSDPTIHINVCETALGTEVDRYDVQDIAVTVPGDDEASERLSKLVWRWWRQNRLDEGQQHAYYNATRDRDSFAIPWYDHDEKKPKLAIHQVYDGEHAGADVFYTDGDPMQPQSAVKIWIAKEDGSKKIRRKNVYYADRVEKWISDGGMTGAYADADWRPLRFGDDDYSDDLVEMPSLSQPNTTATIVWWTETRTERSPGVGIAVKHFRHDARGSAYGSSTIDTLVPNLQDGINRAANDLQAAAVLAGFPANYIIGADRDDTTWSVGPSQLLVIEDSAGNAGQFAAADLRQLIETKDTLIKDAATLTSTPLTYFNLSGVIPAEGTQQSLEMALLAKVKRNQVSFGNTWEDIFRLMLKMEIVWGQSSEVGLTVEQLDDIEINCVWEDARVKNDKEQTEIAEALKRLGVPARYIFRHLGYKEDEIDEMLTQKDAVRNQALGRIGAIVNQTEVETAQAQALALEETRREGAQNAANNGAD